MPSLILDKNSKKTQLKVKLSDNEYLNQQDISIINSGVIPGMVTPKISSGKKLTYTMLNVIDLKAFLSQAIMPNVKADIFSKIKAALVAVEQNGLNFNNLLLSEVNVFVDCRTGNVYLIYLPIINPNDNSNFKYLISSLIQGDDLQKLDVLGADYAYLNSVISAEPFVNQHSNLNHISANQMEMIYDETTVLDYENSGYGNYLKDNGYYTSNVNNNLFAGNMQNNQYGTAAELPYGATEPLDNQAFESNNDFPVETLTSLPLNNPNELGITEPLDLNNNGGSLQYDNFYNSGNTVAFDSWELPTVAKLIVQKTGSEFPINKKEFFVGSSFNDCDCAIENGFISKRQLTIINENGNYYAIDNGSTNGTTLNGDKMNPGLRYQLKDDDRLILANEIVDFKM